MTGHRWIQSADGLTCQRCNGLRSSMADRPCPADAPDHSLCAPEDHDRSLSETPGEQAADADGLLLCSDCLRPAFYCANDDRYHHVNLEASCFLIP